MQRARTLILLIVAAIVAWYTIGLRNLGVGDGLLALRHSGRTFDPDLWRAREPNTRGQMLADLARKHQLVGAQTSTIKSLLGPSECYVAYGDEPCYELAFDGEKHLLTFYANHSNRPGLVIGVSIE